MKRLYGYAFNGKYQAVLLILTNTQGMIRL
ncbi:MAG: hypothetical protein JWR61_553 [Ferruginibacter sp.]|nr:hypothetical protein [Ferruginibacter sp.]